MLRRRRSRLPARGVVAVSLSALLVAAGCLPGGVRVTFRPDAGDRFVYRIDVASVTETTFSGGEPVREDDEVTLRAEHHVLARDSDGTTVRVRLAGAGAPRTFVVRLDGAARLVSVERVENIPASALSSLGLPEIFPAATGVPPDRRLRPGERWTVDDEVALPGVAQANLRGHGRLAELAVHDGRDVAVLSSEVEIALRPPDRLEPRRPTLEGRQSTRTRSVHTVADGALESAEATTRGDFTVTVAPPAGSESPPVTGTLRIQVRSSIELISRS